MKTIDELKHMGRALRHHNYRMFFIGQSVSLVGTWMQAIAIGWLVYRLTRSEFLLGLVSFCSQAPTLIFAPFSGVLADRLDKYRLLVATQSAAMLQAAALALAAYTGHAGIPLIIALSIALGFINAFDMPIRQSFIVHMVQDRADLPNAIALNSLMINGARLVGPAAAGIVVAAAGEKVCFMLNAISFIAVLWALSRMRLSPNQQAENDSGPVLSALMEGIRYAFQEKRIRDTLCLFAVINFLGTPYGVLMPVFAKEVFGGGVHTFGFLVSSTGIGALAGSLFVASRKDTNSILKIIGISTIIFGCGLLLFSSTPHLLAAYIFLMIAGCGMMVQIACTNTALQTFTIDRMRGRVMSFYAVGFFGMATLGSLALGAVASHLGAPSTIRISSILCAAAGILFLRFRFSR